MYASHFNWLQVSFRRTSLSSTGFESRKGERFPRAQGRRYLPVSASILLYFESLILNPTLRTRDLAIPNSLLAEKNSLIRVCKYPVPFRREFGWRQLNLAR